METLYSIEVSDVGDTAWLTGHDGSCVGRFRKRFGIDVHRTVTERIARAGQCLYCTHEAVGEGDWHDFRAAVVKHHAIGVPFYTIQF